MKNFFKAFKNFLLEGDVISLAVGVIIGAAMKDLVTSLVENIFSPVIGLVLGKADLSNLAWNIDSEFFGEATIKYGAFITALINFILMAFVVFLIVYLIDKAKESFKKMVKKEEVEAEPTTKVCPYCQSEISIKATKCPHCTSEIK
ncbi:MAG: large conductance mechanosensitive channel protein MscL [Clostridia bacterium]|nr:large conductance mechanosensitive channel protein MscL [Clostridia bacterium]